VVVSPGFDFVFSVPVKSLAGKSISEMTYFVSSGMNVKPALSLLTVVYMTWTLKSISLSACIVCNGFCAVSDCE